MINLCPNGINIPELLEETCGGCYTKDNCVIHPQSITELNLPVNSSVNTIVIALVTALVYKEQQISELTQLVSDLTTRVETLEGA